MVCTRLACGDMETLHWRAARRFCTHQQGWLVHCWFLWSSSIFAGSSANSKLHLKAWCQPSQLKILVPTSFFKALLLNYSESSCGDLWIDIMINVGLGLSTVFECEGRMPLVGSLQRGNNINGFCIIRSLPKSPRPSLDPQNGPNA